MPAFGGSASLRTKELSHAGRLSTRDSLCALCLRKSERFLLNFSRGEWTRAIGGRVNGWLRINMTSRSRSCQWLVK
eukprot:scaffold3909_cov117-Isochrysis_galbana.AAC.1